MHLDASERFTFYSEVMVSESTVTYLQVFLQEEEAAARHNLAKLTPSQGWARVIAVITELV